MLLRLGGDWKPMTGAKGVAGAGWRTVVAVRVYASGDWREVANFTAPPDDPGPPPDGMTLSISPSPVLTSGSSALIVSGTVTATPSGGLAPYTYAWTASGDHTISVSSRTSASTKFTASGVLAAEPSAQGTATCTVTDRLGNSTSAQVELSFTRI